MEIFEKKRTRFLNRFKVLLPVSLLVFLCLSFLFSINYTSEETLQKQQQMLIQSLENGAVHTYALEGRYPENLDQLLDNYHITYDSKKFVIEYVPSGANLFPMISVLTLNPKN